MTLDPAPGFPNNPSPKSRIQQPGCYSEDDNPAMRFAMFGLFRGFHQQQQQRTPMTPTRGANRSVNCGA